MITMIISCKELIFMKDGFIKVAACTPEIQVADVDFNVDKIISQLEKCREEGVKVAVFPELCITGYTCQDLFFQNALLDRAMYGAVKIAKKTCQQRYACGCWYACEGKGQAL